VVEAGGRRRSPRATRIRTTRAERRAADDAGQRHESESLHQLQEEGREESAEEVIDVFDVAVPFLIGYALICGFFWWLRSKEPKK
jgi:hypothetical protein